MVESEIQVEMTPVQSPNRVGEESKEQQTVINLFIYLTSNLSVAEVRTTRRVLDRQCGQDIKTRKRFKRPVGSYLQHQGP